MNYSKILSQCATPAIGAAVTEAIGQLFEKQIQLLEIDANERTISPHLAGFLGPRFDGYDIDVDYNRMGDAPKVVTWNEHPDKVYPDIIVHKRLTNHKNLLVIELKKTSNPESKADDVKKLVAYRRELHYQHALFIRLGVGTKAGTVTECEWV